MPPALESSEKLHCAIFFIPQNEVYSAVSNLLGYDIRYQTEVASSLDTFRSQLRKQNHTAAPYGAHLTVTDVITVNSHQLERITKRAEFICGLRLFRNITLKLAKIDTMPNVTTTIALQFHRNWRLVLLHTLLALFVQPVGETSVYRDTWRRYKGLQRIKARFLLSPYCLNDFLPHITLVANAADPKVSSLRMRKDFQKLAQELHITSLTVVCKQVDDTYFTVHRDLSLE